MMFYRNICSPCITKTQEEAEQRQKKEEAEKKEERWRKICPPIYRDTDQTDERLNREALKAALEWRGDSKGLGFIGTTGRGKTRSLFIALRRAFEAGRSCVAITHNHFTRVVQDAFAGEGEEKRNARTTLERLKNWDVLLLDDLGKPPSTDRADSELEELIEHRTAYKLPILWSANGSGEWLIARLGQDRGPALVRRLGEFSTVITLK